MLRIALCVLVVGAWAMARSGRATTITFVASGTVTESDAYIGSLAISPGDPIRWVYSFDSEALDTDPWDETHGDYLSNPVSNLIHIGSESIDFGTSYSYFIAVWTDDLLNLEFLHSASYRVGTQRFEEALVLSSGEVIYLDANIELFDTSGTALATDALPILPPILSNFGVTRIQMTFYGGYTIAASVASITVSEPSQTLPLLLATAAVLLRRGSFRRRPNKVGANRRV